MADHNGYTIDDVPLIDEDELPLPAGEFTEKLMTETDLVIEEQRLDAPRFDRDLSLEEMSNGLYTRIYNELTATELALQMVQNLDSGHAGLFIQLVKQIEDEAKHARLLGNRLDQLGGDPSLVFERAPDIQKGFWDMARGEDVITTASILNCTSERIARLRHLKELTHYDEQTREIYENVIAPEEKYHAQIGTNVFKSLCTDRDSQSRALETVRMSRETMKETMDQGVAEAYSVSDD